MCNSKLENIIIENYSIQMYTFSLATAGGVYSLPIHTPSVRVVLSVTFIPGFVMIMD